MIDLLFQDIILKLIKYIKYSEDAYSLRQTNKQFYNLFNYYIFNNKKKNIEFLSSFIPMNCYLCKSRNYKTFHIMYDDHPKRCILFCNKWRCQSKILPKLINIYKEDNIYPWIKVYLKNDFFPVKRSSNKYSLGKLASNSVYIFENIPYVRVLFVNSEFYKYNDIDYNTYEEFDLSKYIKLQYLDLLKIEGNKCFLSWFKNIDLNLYNKIINLKIN